MENIRATVIVVWVSLIYFTGDLANGNPGRNWFEAQKICKGRGGISTEIVPRNEEYWTGLYIRLSHWIKIMGCYPDSDIKNNTHQVTKTMAIKSVGACQEICNYENSSTFAVKLHDCTCLKGKVRFESMSPYLPSKCNFSCDNKDGIYSEDCGGEGAHNVYISDQAHMYIFFSAEYNFDKNKRCLSLQCTQESSIYILQSCAQILIKICQNSNASGEGNADNWTNSMNTCKNSKFSSYLYGDLDLTNANRSCHTLPTGTSVLRWVGIARQEYTNIDQGLAIDKKEEGHFQLCQRCDKNANCSFSTCYDKITKRVFCSKRMTTEIPVTGDMFTTATISTRQSMNTEQITMFTRTTSLTEKQPTTRITSTLMTTQSNPQTTTVIGATSTPEQQQTTVKTSSAIASESPQANSNTPHMIDEDGTLNTLIPIILGVVFPVLAIALLIIYIRRRNIRKSSKGLNKTPQELEGANNTHTKVDNPSYFVIETIPSNELGSSMLESESPYKETEEGDYDHLRNRSCRKKDVKDTYQHQHAVINGDISHYDSTTTNQKQGLRNKERIINRNKNEEPPNLEGDNSTYSEVDNIPDSAYFVLEKPSPYELADNSVIDSESPYNEAEEGDYDHLRNKGSRKKDVEDTYQHATFDGNRDISDYDFSVADQKQEFESSYDHTHESLKPSRNSNYGYSSIEKACVE